MTPRIKEIIANVERQLPKWRIWFASEHSEVDVPRCDLLTLIEAAKVADELLAVCKSALTMIGHNHWDHTMQHGAGCELCIHQRKVSEQIRAAIAKAEPAETERNR